MTQDDPTVEEIRRRGLDALARELGPAGLIRFLQLFESGEGDYTKDRHKWLGGRSIDEIVDDVRQRN